MNSKRRVVIVGGGKMGGDIAVVFAGGGWSVDVVEPSAATRARLAERTATALRALRSGVRSARSVRAHESIESVPWAGANLVVETVPEILALKREVLADVSRLAPRDAIVTTNSSSLRLAEVMTHVAHKSRTAGVHWLTPAHIAPLVEVVRGPKTSDATIRRVNAWLSELGKLAINLNRDVPGMLVNRVQHAMMREAFNLLDGGIVSAEDIDAAVRFGFGFRYVACGPVRQRDLNGLTIHLQSAAQIYPTLHNGPDAPRCLAKRVRDGHVGVQAGKGFYEWNPRTRARAIARIDALMREALSLMETDLGTEKQAARKRAAARGTDRSRKG
ncbi:MAG TPA: 3-hydroxyacyl-CoA dehydrogenase NAD-binding domain-containing protein [Burkholderiales bacterium]|nr:3-hydroxyacyl-CoA dehydrogenase NAD-binding domain-containing protein [Burkholderiales bacterium]